MKKNRILFTETDTNENQKKKPFRIYIRPSWISAKKKPPIKKKYPENVIEIVRNLSGIYFSCPENVRKMFRKMIKVAVQIFCMSGNFFFMSRICLVFWTWTKSGQINWTNSGHEKFQKFFPDIFWTWKNSGQILDK